MRMKIPRGRGRPRGKYRSHADFRLLEYLALTSTKYGIASEQLFASLVQAWKQQKSTCKNLLIECRKKTRDYAVFLITESLKVVAQFHIPHHILEETNPLEMFARTRTAFRTIPKKTKVEHPHIEDLKPGMNRIKLEARVLEVPRPRSVTTRFGGFAVVTNASIADETGSIQLPLWNNQIDAVSVGDLIQVENARVVTFRGERQLRISRGGQLSVLEKGDSPLQNAF